MDNQDDKQKTALNKTVPPYARLFFDHLYSEYVALKTSITNPDVVNLLEGIHQKRQQRDLTWSDIYTFDLTLVDARPAESLIRKAYDARAKYRSVAGQKEYDEYIASKPLDLGSVQIDPDAQPPKPNVIIERELRADIKYLLSKFYLYYALLPVREALRDDLTKKAVLLTGGAVLLIILAIGLNLGGYKLIPGLSPYSEVLDQYSAVVVTVLTVALSGIVGGCVSMLQRIQSAPSEGDALFNLAALTNGWRGIMLSPLYGGIFASLLFVLFAGGILDGSVFPTIQTPGKNSSSARPVPTPARDASPVVASSVPASPQPTNPSGTASPSPSSTVAASVPASPQPANASPTTSTSPSPASMVAVTELTKPQNRNPPNLVGTPTPQAAAPKPEPASVPARASGVLQIKDFLKDTGPASGISYSLLIIWSFLAGFAERLVPDTLNRLVQKNIDIQGGNG